jgi:hypothetical protein
MKSVATPGEQPLAGRSLDAVEHVASGDCERIIGVGAGFERRCPREGDLERGKGVRWVRRKGDDKSPGLNLHLVDTSLQRVSSVRPEIKAVPTWPLQLP